MSQPESRTNQPVRPSMEAYTNGHALAITKGASLGVWDGGAARAEVGKAIARRAAHLAMICIRCFILLQAE